MTFPSFFQRTSLAAATYVESDPLQRTSHTRAFVPESSQRSKATATVKDGRRVHRSAGECDADFFDISRGSYIAGALGGTVFYAKMNVEALRVR